MGGFALIGDEWSVLSVSRRYTELSWSYAYAHALELGKRRPCLPGHLVFDGTAGGLDASSHSILVPQVAGKPSERTVCIRRAEPIYELLTSRFVSH